MRAPLEVLNQLDTVRAGTLQRLDSLTQNQLDWKPPAKEGEEAWSLGEVFMHLAIDEHYLREQIARPLLEGAKPPDGIHFVPPPPPYGAQKEVIRFWLERPARSHAACLKISHQTVTSPSNTPVGFSQ